MVIKRSALGEPMKINPLQHTRSMLVAHIKNEKERLQREVDAKDYQSAAYTTAYLAGMEKAIEILDQYLLELDDVYKDLYTVVVIT